MLTATERDRNFSDRMLGGITYAENTPFWKAYLKKLLKTGKSNPKKLAYLINTKTQLATYLIQEGYSINYDWTSFFESSWNNLKPFSQNTFNQMGLLVQCSEEWKLKLLFSGLGKQKSDDPIISANFIRFNKEVRDSDEYNDYWTHTLLIQDYKHKAFIEGYLEDDTSLVFPTSNTYYNQLLKTLGDGYTYRNNLHLQGWLTNFIAGLELPERKSKYKKRFDLVAATSPHVDEDIKKVYISRVLKNRLDVSEYNMYYFPEENYPELLDFITPKETDEIIASLISKRRTIPVGLRDHFIKNIIKYNVDDLVIDDWLPSVLNAYLTFRRYSNEFTNAEVNAMCSYYRKQLTEFYELPIDYITQEGLLTLMKTAGTEKLMSL